MDGEPKFTLVDAESARRDATRLFETVAKTLTASLPPSADIRHIGATAVPGCLTKGDLDILVRVPAADFSDADTAIASSFARNEESIRTEGFSAFENAAAQPHLGIQLTVIDGPHDFFHLFIEALRQSPQLVEDYNALKLRHDGYGMARYRKAKDAFIERVLAQSPRSK